MKMNSLVNIILLLTVAVTVALCGNIDGSIARVKRHLHHIIDGSYATNCEFPWMVALIIKTAKGYFLCGGSIIDSKHILTAAHCVVGAEHVKVSAGGNNINNMKETMIVTKDNIHANKKYTGPPKFQNDVTVLTLPKAITFNSCRQPIPMAQYGDSFTQECVIAGWGQTGADASTAKFLETVKVNLYLSQECKSYYPYVTDQQICAGSGVKGGAEACHGDSGGPLMCRRSSDGKLTVVGTTSYGAAKCQSGMAVYENVAYFRKWIQEMREI
ncbi:chymotrypsinogen A [Octopus bimaculoides]|uniref:Peptidase S1 domain-containing protein n=1 Tax=Octopus bimaculoides TaxID=37653 RepID=A0A0L8HFZ5_OCTBM|nr:chymotrypsinogen A [Octopus bimaculoides]|eukprot:XP_014772671.1 PREDICTED: chymotrypsinogen A-like [Octopus bimaculoides]